MNIEADVLPFRLAETGLYVTSCTPVFSGVQQHRYTLRHRQSGLFVAFICWYEKPTSQRSFGSRLSKVGVNAYITTAELSPVVAELAGLRLKRLRRRHLV